MAIKMFEILLNLSLIFVILKGFEACARNNVDDSIERAVRSVGGSSKPNVNCKELAAKLGKSWQTFNIPHNSDCRKFYGCADGKLVERSCAVMETTRFNPFANRCDWNADIDCILFDEWKELISTHNCEY